MKQAKHILFLKFYWDDRGKALINPIIEARNLIRATIKEYNRGDIGYQEYNASVQELGELTRKKEKAMFEILKN